MSKTREILRSLSKTLPRHEKTPADFFRDGEDALIDAQDQIEKGQFSEVQKLVLTAVFEYMKGYVLLSGLKSDMEPSLGTLFDEVVKTDPALERYRSNLMRLGKINHDNDMDDPDEVGNLLEIAGEFIDTIRRTAAKQMRTMRMPRR